MATRFAAISEWKTNATLAALSQEYEDCFHYALAKCTKFAYPSIWQIACSTPGVISDRQRLGDHLMKVNEGTQISQRALRLAALKLSIQDGTYHVPASVVADAIVNRSMEHLMQVGTQHSDGESVNQKPSNRLAPANGSSFVHFAFR